MSVALFARVDAQMQGQHSSFKSNSLLKVKIGNKFIIIKLIERIDSKWAIKAHGGSSLRFPTAPQQEYKNDDQVWRCEPLGKPIPDVTKSPELSSIAPTVSIPLDCNYCLIRNGEVIECWYLRQVM